MTDMTRLSVSLPDEMYDAIINMRKTDAFCKKSLSEIVRYLIDQGIRSNETEAS